MRTESIAGLNSGKRISAMLLEDTDRPNETLFHKDIGFPDNINMPDGFHPVMNLTYSEHAKKAATDDRYGEMHLPHRVDIRKAETVEIGVVGRTVTKLVLRFSYSRERGLDIIMVIKPESGFVKTVWFNETKDQHKTLDRSKYMNPKQYAQQFARR